MSYSNWPASPSSKRKERGKESVQTPREMVARVLNNAYHQPSSFSGHRPSSPARQRRRNSRENLNPSSEPIRPARTTPPIIGSTLSNTTATTSAQNTSQVSSSRVPGSPRPLRNRSTSLPLTIFDKTAANKSPNALAESTRRAGSTAAPHHVLWTTQKETLVSTSRTTTPPESTARHHKEPNIDLSTTGSSYKPRQYSEYPLAGSSLTKLTPSIKTSQHKLFSPSSSSSSSPPTHSPSPTTTTSTATSINYVYMSKPHNSTDVSSSHRRTQSDSSTPHLPPIVNNKTSRSIQSPPKTNIGLVGLHNSGNSCYMNSVLQCLSLTVDLTNYFLSGTYKREKPTGKGTPITDAYNKFLETKSKADKAIAPAYLRSVMSSQVIMVRTTEQQDAQEFLLYLLCCIHEEMNIPIGKPSSHSCTNLSNDSINEAAAVAWKDSLAFDNSFLSKLFMGQIRSTLTCCTCHNVVTNFETFWSLSLPLPRSKTKYSGVSSACASITDCFRLYSSEEKLDHDNKPMCSRCKSPQTSKKSLSVQKFPKILILHLKRFSMQSRYTTKLATNIQVPSILNVDEVAADKESVQSFHYDLYGVINHSGSISFGHYKADCKHGSKWYCLNDKIVTSSSETYITSPSPMPYVLFYERKKDILV